MKYRWTIELNVDVAEIQLVPKPGETWYALACRDISGMEAPATPFGDTVTNLEVDFGLDDSLEDDEAHQGAGE